jgi:hypothetical protein
MESVPQLAVLINKKMGVGLERKTPAGDWLAGVSNGCAMLLNGSFSGSFGGCFGRRFGSGRFAGAGAGIAFAIGAGAFGGSRGGFSFSCFGSFLVSGSAARCHQSGNCKEGKNFFHF